MADTKGKSVLFGSVFSVPINTEIAKLQNKSHVIGRCWIYVIFVARAPAPMWAGE